MAWSIFKILVLASLLAAFPRPTWACSVCFSAQGDTLLAYYGTTLFMILFPLALVGAFVYWLYRQHRKHSA